MMASRKRKLSSSEILSNWKEDNSGKIPPKGSKKGCMKGKGGPENLTCRYRGVRQRTSGKWVSEIRKPNKGGRLWLGTFSTAIEASMAYDEAARTFYGSNARLNLLPESSSSSMGESSISNYAEEYSLGEIEEEIEIVQAHQHGQVQGESVSSSVALSCYTEEQYLTWDEIETECNILQAPHQAVKEESNNMVSEPSMISNSGDQYFSLGEILQAQNQ